MYVCMYVHVMYVCMKTAQQRALQHTIAHVCMYMYVSIDEDNKRPLQHTTAPYRVTKSHTCQKKRKNKDFSEKFDFSSTFCSKTTKPCRFSTLMCLYQCCGMLYKVMLWYIMVYYIMLC